MSTSSRGSENRFKMMPTALATVLVLGLFSMAQLPALSSAQKFSLDSSLDRTFRTAAYVQRSNYNRKLFGLGRTYSSDFSEFSKISGKNIQEKDIAAIFRGVAYGLTESSDVTTTSTTSSPPPPTTTSPKTTTLFSFRRKTTRVPLIDENTHLASETLQVVSANADPEINEISREESDSRNGILNYFVEEGDENFHESSHSGRREFYPEVISSVEPSIVSGSRSNKKYVVSQNGDRQSIDVHVYLIGILMGLVALASLCCLCRIHSCTQLIPRGHYVTLQLLILLAAALRCIILFHDPYGLNGKLPRALISLLINTVPPILSTTFALMLLVLLRAAKFFILPASLQSPLVLAVIGGIHICFSVMVDISNGVLEYPKSSRPLEAGVQCVTAGWDTLLVIGYCIILYQAFMRSTKRHMMLPQYTCAVVAIAVTIKALLIVFMFYHIFNEGFDSHVAGNTRTWSWWVMVSCERLLEIFLCLSLLTAAATLTMKQTVVSTNEQKVFSVVSGYDQPTKFNTAGRSPGNKNFMATNYALASTLQKKGSTMNSNCPKIFSGNQNVYDSSCEFKMQWNTPNQPDICSRVHEVQDNYQYKMSDQTEGLCEKANFGTLKPNQSPLFSQTLPPPRYYCAPVPVIEHEAPVVGRLAPYTLRPQKTPNIYCEIEEPTYEQESSYYTKPIPSTSSDIYSSPHYVASRYTQSHSTDHLYELPGVHQTSTPVDHGTNSRKSENSYQQNAIPMGAGVHEPRGDVGSDSYSLMLSLYPNQCPPSRTVSHQRFNNSQLDTSPDSAIVLDYSSHSELEDHNHYNLHSQHTLKDIQEHQQQQDPSNRLDFMKLSTHSLNDVFKHNGGLLSKLVGSGGANTGYQPLNVEDTISISSKPNQFNNRVVVSEPVKGNDAEKHSNLSSQKNNNRSTTIGKISNSPTSGEDLGEPVSSPLLLSGCPSPVTSL